MSTDKEQDGYEPRGASRQLVVLLHAYSLERSSLAGARQAVAEALPDADLLIPELPAATWSTADPNEIVQDLLLRIDRLWHRRWEREGSGYERIVLVGHSLGGLLARKLYVGACGENGRAPLEPPLRASQPRPWAQRVERVVLLAGMNRGWAISHHLSIPNAILWTLGSMVGRVLEVVTSRRPLIFQIRRGSPFITQLRIQWLSMRNHAPRKGVGNALVVQLLGSVDDMVAPEDNTDLVTGRDFVYLDVPRSGHSSVVEMDDSPAGRERRAIFLQALLTEPEALAASGIQPADLRTAVPDRAVTDVVFVIHGIRDKGFWTHRIARRARVLGRAAGRRFATETSSYGYFPMLPFLLYRRRRAKVEWLMDQYTENLALYPNAEFSFVGHSNGTYLLAKALEEYPACYFRNVVFAGSVVRTRFDWQRMIRENRVHAVLNFVATADWVVALFPKAFQSLRLQDLGSAGHDGFVSLAQHEVRYVAGAHGAALQEDFWDPIAHFVVHGAPGSLPAARIRTQPSTFWKLAGVLAPVAWIVLLGILVAVGWGLWSLPLAEWLRTVLLALYVASIWSLVTRV